MTMGRPRLTTEQVEDNFWSRVEKTDNCWIWKGSVNKYGYGVFSASRNFRNEYFNSTQAHRVSYFFAFGDFDRKLDVLHKCDNPRCVNPSHLFLGTHSENMQDMVNKGRHWTQVKPERQEGEKNHMAKLDWNKVREARRLHKEGMSGGKLAKMFGIGTSTMYQVLANETWKE